MMRPLVQLQEHGVSFDCIPPAPNGLPDMSADVYKRQGPILAAQPAAEVICVRRFFSSVIVLTPLANTKKHPAFLCLIIIS